MTIPEASQRIFHTTALSLQDWMIIEGEGALVVIGGGDEEALEELITSTLLMSERMPVFFAYCRNL